MMTSIYSIPSTGFSNNEMDSIFTSIDNYLYPVNSFISHHLFNKNYSYLKTLPFSSEIDVNTYNLYTSTLTSREIRSAEEFQISFFGKDILSYVFIGSKKLLKTIAFESFLPTSYETVLNYFINNGFIKVLGSGFGSAIIFNSNKFDEPFSIVPSDDSYLTLSINSFLDTFNLVKTDNQYLLNKISEKDLYINSLLQDIQNLKNENYQISQMTWR